MLSEYTRVRQEPGAGSRRWWTDGETELIAWYDADNTLTGYQFIYPEGDRQCAATWRSASGLHFARLDAGSSGPYHSLTPILDQRPYTPGVSIRHAFLRSAENLDPELRGFILKTFAQHRVP